MDGLVLTIFLLASFLGGVTSGLAGFAMGLVVSGVYLHFLTPLQTAALIVGYGFVTQGYGVWSLRHAVRWRSAAPFIVGGLSACRQGRCCSLISTRPICALASACCLSSTASTAWFARRSN